jgi:Icc protein
MLDSVIADEAGGHLEAQQLALLDAALEETDRHVLVCMHHQPVDIGSTWIDTMRIDNPTALFDVLDRYDHVRGLLWGHVHQAFDAWRQRLRLMASPSTCVQFAPRAHDFQVGEEAPGFRLLALLPDGTIRTEILRTDDLPQGIELASAGY